MAPWLTLRLCAPCQGLLVTLAIGLHNIPEGLAVATVLVAKGVTARHAFWWTIFTSMPQPLLALPSFVFVDTFRNLLPLALGFAAGCMLWMVFAELLPDALEDCTASKVGAHHLPGCCVLVRAGRASRWGDLSLTSLVLSDPVSGSQLGLQAIPCVMRHEADIYSSNSQTSSRSDLTEMCMSVPSSVHGCLS